MKLQRISICQTGSARWARLAFALGCMLCLLNCDTAFCKIQQANPDSDPFAELERENPELFSPTISAKSAKQSYINLDNTTGSNAPPKSNQFIEVKHGRSGNSESQSQMIGNNLSAGSSEGDIEQLVRQIAERKRPILPERTKPGGLISSCCSDPFMSSALESYLESQLNQYNSDDWDRITIVELCRQLNQHLPTFLNARKLDEEGISDDIPVAGKIPPGAIGARLQDALGPLGLTYVLRRGRLEITTEADVEDGEGVIRIYDVTPLVSQVRDGIEQLSGTITASIDPDSWWQNGGSNVLQSNVIAGENEAITTLVITCPSTTHKRVQDLLDRLNGLAGSSSQTNIHSAVSGTSRPIKTSGFPSQF